MALTIVVFAASAFLALAPPVHAQQQNSQTPPGPVSNLVLTATADSVTVSWQAPQGGGAPNRYIVHIRPSDGGKGKTKTLKAKKTSATFNRLDAGETYKVWVRAKNNSGKGERVRATITLPQRDAAPDSSARPNGDGMPQQDIRPAIKITRQGCFNGDYQHLGITCP